MGDCGICVLKDVCEHKEANRLYGICWLDNYSESVRRHIIDNELHPKKKRVIRY